jgi:tight adherence protein B
MMRRLAALVLVGLACSAAIAVSFALGAGGESAPRLTPVGRLQFPERGFLVDFSRHLALRSSDVRVSENGTQILDPSFVPVKESTQRLGVMLAIDTSNSMRGKPLAAAFAAARGFVAQVSASEPIGLLTFGPNAELALAPTRDAGRLAASLRRPPATAEGTHIYDALVRALDALRVQRLAAGAIVLLSDGADIGSQTTSAAVLARARAEHVRIFTIGLRSPQFDSRTLRALSRGSGAAYSEAGSSAELQAIYAALGSQLANEYLLRYRSQAKAGEQVTVQLRVAGGGEASFDYRASKEAVAPYHRSLAQRFWASSFSFLVVGLLAMALVFAAAFALLRRAPSELATRLAQFISLRDQVAVQPRRSRLPLPSDRLFAEDGLFARSRWWRQLTEEIAIAETKLSPEQIVGGTVVLTLLAFFLLLLVLPIFSVFALGVPLLIRSLHKRQLHRVRERFAEQLPDNLQVLASALRAGHSFIGALALVAADAEWPAKREFRRIVADEQLGVPVEDSLRAVAQRMDSSDFDQVALVAELQRQVGGNMAEVLDRVVETIRGRFDLRRLVKTLTAQGRMARWIVSLLPLVLVGFMSLVNPGYLSPLFGSSGGQTLLVVAALMVVAGSLVIKRIITIKV